MSTSKKKRREIAIQGKKVKKRRQLLIYTLTLVLFSGIMAYLLFFNFSGKDTKDTLWATNSAAGTETLYPELFTGTSKEAYQIAKKIPGILENLKCYCNCKAIGHRGLLDCFADVHGDHCQICKDEAIDAYNMYKWNYSMDKIRERIDEKYSRFSGR